jgi:threonine/homoserine/homoserine lactone efflux protein
MNNLKKLILCFVFTCIQVIANAQTIVADPNANDLMRSNGRIFLVMTIVVFIVAGLLVYVYSLDRKISKLEKK